MYSSLMNDNTVCKFSPRVCKHFLIVLAKKCEPIPWSLYRVDYSAVQALFSRPSTNERVLAGLTFARLLMTLSLFTEAMSLQECSFSIVNRSCTSWLGNCERVAGNCRLLNLHNFKWREREVCSLPLTCEKLLPWKCIWLRVCHQLQSICVLAYYFPRSMLPVLWKARSVSFRQPNRSSSAAIPPPKEQSSS